jgi:hypothetical protein
MTESAAASATAPGAAVAATTAAIIAMCFSMIRLITQGEICMMTTRPVRTLIWVKTKAAEAVGTIGSHRQPHRRGDDAGDR